VPIKNHFACGQILETDDASCQCRFTATCLADQSECFTAMNIEADVINGAHMLPATEQAFSLNGKMFYEVFDAKQNLAHGLFPTSRSSNQHAASCL